SSALPRSPHRARGPAGGSLVVVEEAVYVLGIDAQVVGDELAVAVLLARSQELAGQESRGGVGLALALERRGQLGREPLGDGQTVLARPHAEVRIDEAVEGARVEAPLAGGIGEAALPGLPVEGERDLEVLAEDLENGQARGLEAERHDLSLAH